MSDQTIDDTPWEVSVFAALLNMRWAQHVRTVGHLPDLVNALDGAAETALGDVLLREDDRLFLFELKASWERVASETKKPIFGRYKELYSLAQRQFDSTEFDELLLLSIRCHHVIYWEDSVALSDDSVRGSISFSPYALFVLDHVIGSHSPTNDFRHSHALALSRQSTTSIVEAASIADLFGQTAKAASGNLLVGSPVELSELGLDQCDFLQFVQRLRGKQVASDIVLKLIAFSPVSGFVRRISSLDEAVQLGLDWAAGTASTKPKMLQNNQRAGKARVVGEHPLICNLPASPRNNPQAISGRPRGIRQC